MSAPTRLPSAVAPPAEISVLRKAVGALAVQAVSGVGVVRTAFASGVPPLQMAGSGSVSNFVVGLAPTGSVAAAIVTSTARLGVNTAIGGTVSSAPRPELDLVEIGNDSSFGVVDSFYTRLVVSVALADLAKTSYIRILRSDGGPISGIRKPAFSAMIDSNALPTRSISPETVSNAALQVNANGVGNKLTDLVANDRLSTQRFAIGSSSLRPAPLQINTNRGMTSTGLVSISNVDRSVLENVSFYVNQRSTTPAQQLTLPLTVAQRQGINVLQGSTVGTGAGLIVQVGNSAGYSEIARLVPTGRTIGAYMEIEFFDPSVVYGATYSYYAVTGNASGIEGTRSRIVNVPILRNNPPSTPVVLYGLTAGIPRFSVKCSGTFLDHVEVFRRGGTPPSVVQLLSTDGGMFDDGTSTGTDSGYFHIADVGLGIDRSVTYVDRTVVPGSPLEYHIYTVDSFGLKSPTPFSCSIMLPDPGSFIPLSLPSITAEQTVGGESVAISVTCADPRVSSFVIGRRNAGTFEHSFRQPSEPDWFSQGPILSSKRSLSRSAPSLSQFSSKAWTGILQAVSGVANFTDLSVDFDRSYQYSVTAVDIRGNRSSSVRSSIFTVSVKPVGDSPVALSGSTVLDTDTGSPTGVLITWTGGTSDFSPNDLIGDQDVLLATSRRSVYQVERRELEKASWDVMPATTESYFIDPVSSVESPNFRPAYAIVNRKYDYRVIAMQSGAFLSTHTDPFRISVVPGVTPPSTVWVRSTPTSLRPIHNVISWQYDGRFVAAWEVQRAVTNKIFGSKIFSMSSADAQALAYSTVAQIPLEASFGRGVSVKGLSLDPKVFVGNRFYVDQDVDLANSYFYRVRSIDSVGNISGWIFAGITLSDSPFDRKFLSALSDGEKADLTTDPRPISKWRNG